MSARADYSPGLWNERGGEKKREGGGGFEGGAVQEAVFGIF